MQDEAQDTLRFLGKLLPAMDHLSKQGFDRLQLHTLTLAIKLHVYNVYFISVQYYSILTLQLQ